MSNVNDHTECSYDYFGHDSRDYDCWGHINCTTVAAATVAGTNAAATADAGSYDCSWHDGCCYDRMSNGGAKRPTPNVMLNAIMLSLCQT